MTSFNLNESRSKAQAEARRQVRANIREREGNNPTPRALRLTAIATGTSRPEYKEDDSRGRTHIQLRPELLHEYDDLADRRSREEDQARRRERQIRDDPNSTKVQIATANLATAKASERSDTASNNASRVYRASPRPYYGSDARRAIARRKRKEARKEAVKIPRAERRRRRNERETATAAARAAAREALNSYERQAQEQAHDSDDVRGGQLVSGTILSNKEKKERFVKKLKTPGGNTKAKPRAQKLTSEYGVKPKHSEGASNALRKAMKDWKASKPAPADEPTSSRPSQEQRAPEPAARQSSSPPTQPDAKPAEHNPTPTAAPMPSASQTQSPPVAPNKPKFQIKGKHVAGAALAATGLTAAGVAAYRIHKKRKERKEAEARAAAKARKPLNGLKAAVGGKGKKVANEAATNAMAYLMDCQ